MIMYVDVAPALFYIHMCLNEKELSDLMDNAPTEHKNYNFPNEGLDARFVKTKVKNQIEYIICVSKKAQDKYDPIVLAGKLAHEAVHLWQWYIEHQLGTTSNLCGSEQEAYGIENISIALMEEYANRKFGRKKQYTQ